MKNRKICEIGLGFFGFSKSVDFDEKRKVIECDINQERIAYLKI